MPEYSSNMYFNVVSHIDSAREVSYPSKVVLGTQSYI